MAHWLTNARAFVLEWLALASIGARSTGSCATANPTEVVLAEIEQGRGILGVVDDFTT